jgi:hypothetical protein
MNTVDQQTLDVECRHYRAVTSIGSQCLTSVMLQKAGLKRFSGPFDWIFSNLRMVADCIDDDFAAFLDRDQYRPIPLEHRGSARTQFANHALYHHRYKLAGIFNHSDPCRPDVYAYLVRCVDRFREVLASDHPQLLLAFSRRDQGGLHAFERLCALLETRPSVEILAVIVREPGTHRRMTTWAERGRHRLVNFEPTSPMMGIEFEDSRDNDFVLRLLKQAIVLRE